MPFRWTCRGRQARERIAGTMFRACRQVMESVKQRQATDSALSVVSVRHAVLDVEFHQGQNLCPSGNTVEKILNADGVVFVAGFRESDDCA